MWYDVRERPGWSDRVKHERAGLIHETFHDGKLYLTASCHLHHIHYIRHLQRIKTQWYVFKELIIWTDIVPLLRQRMRLCGYSYTQSISKNPSQQSDHLLWMFLPGNNSDYMVPASKISTQYTRLHNYCRAYNYCTHWLQYEKCVDSASESTTKPGLILCHSCRIALKQWWHQC